MARSTASAASTIVVRNGLMFETDPAKIAASHAPDPVPTAVDRLVFGAVKAVLLSAPLALSGCGLMVAARA